jgi:hypothetical protein
MISGLVPTTVITFVMTSLSVRDGGVDQHVFELVDAGLAEIRIR